MKNTIDISQFNRYLKDHEFNEFSFLSDNQDLGGDKPLFHFKLTFSTMRVSERLGQICLKSNGGDWVRFCGVRKVEVDTDLISIGTVITIFCGESCENRDLNNHILLAL